LLNQEKVSLTDYGRLIGHASKAIMTEDIDHVELGHSIKALKAATEQRANQNSNVVRAVVEKTVALADLQRETEDAEAKKLVDPLTGLASRRAFNRALAKVYANAEMPLLCGMVIGEIDEFARLSELMGPAVSERFLKQVAKVVEAVASAEDLACRFDGGRFGMLLYTSEQEEVNRIVDLVRSKLNTTVVNSGNGRALGQGDTTGFVRMYACAKTDRILGVHVIGNNASELIAEAVVAMEFGACSEDIARICHAHPTLSEVMHEAALACDKRPLHF
jgi:diguanylate cyclase